MVIDSEIIIIGAVWASPTLVSWAVEYTTYIVHTSIARVHALGTDNMRVI